MLTLGIDTSHQFLLLTLMDEEKVIDSIQMQSLKKQSEYITVELEKMLKNHNLTAENIDSIVVTRGPGSYTGVRIGMTVAKVLGSLMNKEVYTLSTLQLYAGLDDCYVITDARAKRVYCGRYKDGLALEEDKAVYNTEMQEIIDKNEVCVKGDLHLFGKEDIYDNLAENMFNLRKAWQKVDNVDILTPVYLKSSQEYMR